MPEYDDKLRGAMWTNEYKKKDTQPDFTGQYTDENGKVWRVAGWKRTYKDKPMVSFVVSEFQDRGSSGDGGGDEPW